MTRVVTDKFIGGPKDGQYIAVKRDNRYVEVAVMNPLPDGWWDEKAGPDSLVDYHTVTYQRAKVAGEKKVFELWMPTDWTGDKLIRTLIERA